MEAGWRQGGAGGENQLVTPQEQGRFYTELNPLPPTLYLRTSFCFFLLLFGHFTSKMHELFRRTGGLKPKRALR